MPDSPVSVPLPVRDPFANHESFRDELVDKLVRQVFGPVHNSPERDQEEILSISPLQLYATGVLFPQNVRQDVLEDSAKGEASEGEDTDDDQSVPVDINEARRRRGTEDAGGSLEELEPLNLANEFSPSALGISFRISSPAKLVVTVTYGTYASTKVTEAHPRAGETRMDGEPFPATREVPAWRRTSHSRDIPIEISEAGVAPPIKVNETGDLTLRITTRRSQEQTTVVSAMLVNEHKGAAGSAPSCDDVFFQVALAVRAADGSAVFLPIDRSSGISSETDPEVGTMELLFRHRRAFALGHGTAGDWNRSEALSVAGATDCVSTAAIPSYDLKPIAPRKTAYRGDTNLRLSMGYLYSPDGADPEREIIEALNALLGDYEAWIGDQIIEAQGLSGTLKDAADANIEVCNLCARRIRKGIDLIGTEPAAMLAFRLMNKAMFVQQYHSRLPRRDLGTPFPAECRSGDKSVWYPFQLAFILMNMVGTFDPDDPERKVVDLIWFPTGGGKTEAYLGLSAFTIILGRLRGEATGTTVLMRYTLRLLTAQQFQRASALVLALELIRRNGDLGADLGETPISIGLWVGKSLSPNSRDEARAKLRQLRQDKFAPNPFQVLQCPWCGVEFTNRSKLGYEETRSPVDGERTIGLVCPDTSCAFSSSPLPVLVVDEDIYASPPTILIGTVDKFAQVAWLDQVARIFGIGTDAPPPALVIQDELHLISGPLGTIVGLYETAIDRLCSRDGFVHKIIASTATIRRATQQCWDLYCRDTFQFPAQALRAGESYFAFEDTSAPGRKYIGVMGNAVKSHQTALVRVCAPLLQGVCYPLREDEDEKRAIADPYGTLVWYFNSLRELGHAATLCAGDIPEFLKGLCHRQGIPYENRRFIREVVELTSRRSADEIPEILQQLSIPWRMRPTGQPPVDILLATNMIAVGVDVPRLGVIVMSGQPKGTSEYIQASSRVGRSVPGLVVTVYTQTKSRDRSHYERFVSYHQSLYRHVEPTSVTPFSPEARERGVRGVLIALSRLLGHVDRPNEIGRKLDVIQEQAEAILARAGEIDSDELPEMRQELREWVDFWKNYAPPEYGRMGGTVSEQTLMYPYGGVPDENFQRDAWPVLTSMRNVDGTSAALVLNTYTASEPEDPNGPA